MEEVVNAVEFVRYVYNLFDIKCSFVLSTRPKKAIGDREVWNDAEDQLKAALNKAVGNEWTYNKGDGAFYGPKIDIRITDAMNRKHQCATIQLDFMMPMRFNLQYQEQAAEEAKEVDEEEKEDKKA